MSYSIEELFRVAKAVSSSSASKYDANTAFVIMLRGQELGFKAIQSLELFQIIQGKPSPTASAMRSLAMASPHCEYLRCTESTDERATFVTKRRGDPQGEQSLTYTMEEAIAAGHAKKGQWKTYPKQLLRARATTELVRLVYPDAVDGLYTREELGEDVFDDAYDPKGDTEHSMNAQTETTPHPKTSPVVSHVDLSTPTPQPSPPRPPIEPSDSSDYRQELAELNMEVRRIQKAGDKPTRYDVALYILGKLDGNRVDNDQRITEGLTSLGVNRNNATRVQFAEVFANLRRRAEVAENV